MLAYAMGEARTKFELRREADGVVIRLEGPIDEHFNRLQFVSSSTNGVVIVDLDAVPWITSFGVREWVQAIQAIPNSYLAFINARPILVQQFNMVAAFAGAGQLLSFYAPYVCPHCGHSQEAHVDLLALYPKIKQLELPPVACASCGKESELDELVESYLLYVSSSRPPDPPPAFHTVLSGGTSKLETQPPLKIGKLVEGTVTMLLLTGDLDGRASFKRALAGLEGTVAVSMAELQGFDRQGLQRLRPLWEGTGDEILLVDVPLNLALELPSEAWRRLKIFSLRTELVCPGGHVLKRALVQNNELWRLAKGNDPLPCPSCGNSLAAPKLDELTARNALAEPTEDTAIIVREVDRAQRAPASTAEFKEGEQFGRFTLVELLGVGGMAEVYRAQQTGLAGFEKTVVVKRILPHLAREPRFVGMFLEEARLAARISHPNVVQIYDIGQTDDGSFYIVMEHIAGWDLSQLARLATRVDRPFPVHLAARICSDLASALDAAHSATDLQGNPTPIIHRDVSPHNVLISKEGAVKLTDFGIAKALESGALTPTATLKGKLAYLAPEVALGTGVIDTRADLFPLGIILYQLITLTRLFHRASDYATVHALLHDRIAPLRELLPDVPRQLDDIALRALARRPEARFPTARQMRDDLENFLGEYGMSSGANALAEYVGRLVEDAGAALPEPQGATRVTIEFARSPTRRDHGDR
jgi:hypothetical protein